MHGANVYEIYELHAYETGPTDFRYLTEAVRLFASQIKRLSKVDPK